MRSFMSFHKNGCSVFNFFNFLLCDYLLPLLGSFFLISNFLLFMVSIFWYISIQIYKIGL